MDGLPDVAYVTIATKVEMEFSPGVWTDMSTPGYVDAGSAIRIKRGVAANRQPFASTASFNLDNADEVFTPGNTSSAFFNKLRRGVGVRISTTYSASTLYHFRGIVTDIKPIFPATGQANLRVGINCKGISGNLSRQKRFPMGLVTQQPLHVAAAAIMDSAGWSLYSFASSTVALPFVYPKSDALTDLVGLYQSDPTQILFEDGQGRLRSVSVIGGYSSPTHTWGTTIVPDGDLQPDWRHASQYSRQVVNLTKARPSEQNVTLLDYPVTTKHGYGQFAPRGSTRFYRGTFDEFPLSAAQKFSIQTTAFPATTSTLYAQVSPTEVSLKVVTTAPPYPDFKPFDELILDVEEMLITGVTTTGSGGVYTTLLGVQRGYAGTVGATHVTGTIIYRRPGLESTSYAGFLGASVDSTNTTIKLSQPGITPKSGDLFDLEGELLQVGSTPFYNPTGNFYLLNCSRGVYGTNVKPHLVPLTGPGPLIYRAFFSADPSTATAISYLKSSIDPDGIEESNDVHGTGIFAGANHINVVGNKWIAFINTDFFFGEDSEVRYLKEMIIGGRALKVNETSQRIEFEQAIPYLEGIEEGPSVSMPYGTSDLPAAQMYCLGLLSAARKPSPWITTPPFVVSLDANVASVRVAEIGDLVRWTGLGTYREQIDEFYRILGVDYSWDANGIMYAAFTLAPAHEFRHPTGTYTQFTQTRSYQGLFPGEIYSDVGIGWAEVNGGVDVTDYTGGVTTDAFAYWQVISAWGPQTIIDGSGCSPKDSNVSHPVVADMGSADHVVRTIWRETSFTGESFVSNISGGGYGAIVRSNSARTAYWRVFFNRTTGFIYLANTTDGVVASYAWTAPAAGTNHEIEVYCQGNRIRVYLDCGQEPIIDFTSTRFNTQTYCGWDAKMTGAATNKFQLQCLEVYRQRL